MPTPSRHLSRDRRNRTQNSILAAGGLALILALPAGAQVTINGLPDLGGGTHLAEARAVSDDGSVVVGTGVSDSSYGGSHSDQEGAMWAGGTTYALGDLPGGDYASIARGVSADGAWVVGSSRGKHTGWSFSQWRACVWGPSGILQELPNLAGVDEETTHAQAVSGDGAVIVGMSDGTATTNQAIAVRWTSAGAEALGLLPTNNETRAQDVSDDGTVIVGTASGGGPNHAFVWIEGAGMFDLGANTEAEAVSADGTFVVGKMAGGDAGRWSAAEGWVSLGSALRPRGVSNDGQVVVGTATGPGFSFARVWTPAGGIRNLATVIESEWGHDAGGWTFQRAWDVSPDGTRIVGRGKNPAGLNDGYVVTLPRETWTELGHALAGTKGEPTLHGTGSLLPGTPMVLSVGSAVNSSPVVLVVGTSRIDAPWLGGTFVPSPTLLLGGTKTGQSGTLTFGISWPSDIDAGTELYFQYWIIDALGPQGASATNALALVSR